jgi:hypothetical protein
VKPPWTAVNVERAALVVATAMFWALRSSSAEPAPTYTGRPIYSDPTNGLQLPPACVIEPTWRSRISGTEMEVWVLNCDSVPRAWLLTRQIVETLGAHEARLRFQVLDERLLPDETTGESLSVQCTGASDTPGIIVYGAHWNSSAHELRLHDARGALRVDVARRRLVDANLAGIDCVRFPERESMMRKLQQPDRPPTPR